MLMDVFQVAPLAVQIPNGSNRSVTMADERNPQDELKDEVKHTEDRPEELSDEELDQVAGGTAPITFSVSNVLKTRHDTAQNSINNLR